jgi:CRISPR/Cas system-associated endonuclease Cas1
MFGTLSLICDFQEPYRYLIDDFVIDYARKLTPKDFILMAEDYSSNRKGKRQSLNDTKTRDFTKKLNNYFKTTV